MNKALFALLNLFSFSLLILVSGAGVSTAQTPDAALTNALNNYISDLKPRLEKEKTEIVVYVKSINHDTPVFAEGESKFLHAASVQKLLITYAALKKLGAEYRFPTEFYTDYLPKDRDPRIDVAGGLEAKVRAPENSLGNLYVRSYGDPLMQFEHFQKIARELKARGLNGVQDLVLDDSLFLEPSEPSGIDPYQAANSAAALEYNTYRIQANPSASGLPALIQGSPGLFGKIENKSKTLSGRGTSLAITQSPSHELYPRFTGKGEIKPRPLQIVVDGRIGISDPLWEKYHTHPDPFTNFILSLRKALELEGININGTLRRDIVPVSGQAFYTSESEPLYTILARLNRVSSNFIAGQLLYAIGQNKDGIFSRELGLENLIEEIETLVGPAASGMFLADASGLSSANRINALIIGRVLEEAEKNLSMAPVFISSLSRFGYAGTLKDRDLLDESKAPGIKTSIFLDQRARADGVWAKTGTVEGTSSLAGYVDRGWGFRMAFMIVLTGKLEKARAVEIEDDIVRILLGLD